MLVINTALARIQPRVQELHVLRAHIYTHTRTSEERVRGGDDGVAIETVLFQVWSVRMIKSSNELSYPTYLMPFELSEYKPEYNHCKQKLSHLFAILTCWMNKHLVHQRITVSMHTKK